MSYLIKKEEKNCIRSFSREEFNTTAPYELLFKFRSDRFKFGQVQNTLADNALNVGFKGFNKMFKLYAESQAVKGVPVDNTTQFDGQPMELKTGAWIADDNGISINDGCGGENIACVHPIMPVERLTNIDSGITKLKIAFRLGDTWKSEIYDKKMLAGANSIIELANNDIAVTSENARHLVRYLNDVDYLNYDTIPRKKSVSRLGWINDGEFSPYVDDIVFDGISNFKQSFDAVRSAGDFGKWLDIAREVRKTDSSARITLAASFASVLIKPLHKLNFMNHLWGGTEAGKTVAIMLSASVWGNPGEDGIVKTFNTTSVGIELMEGFMNSIPLFLDEFQLEKNRKDFDGTIYMICEGIGRTRGKKTGGLQDTYVWKNCAITSGETPITNSSSGGGAVNRVIEIECNEALFADAPLVADTIRENYGYAGKIFVSELVKDGVMSEVRTLYGTFYTALGVLSTEKQRASAALILTADALATRWIFQDDRALTVEDITRVLQSKDDVDNCLRGYDYLRGVLASNAFKFYEVGKPTPQYEIWGNTSNGEIRLLSTAYKRICSEGGFDSRALGSWMKKNKLIETDSDANRNTKKVRINGSPENCICLIANKSTGFISMDDLTPEEQEALPFV